MEQAHRRDDVVAYETAKENTDIKQVTNALAEVMPTPQGKEIGNIVYDDFTMAFQARLPNKTPCPNPALGRVKGNPTRRRL